jgi:hypothetical protein
MTQGEFIGIDQFAHVHTLSAENAAVAVLFNLTSEPIARELALSPAKLGLKSIGAINGAKLLSSDEYGATIRVEIPAMSPLLVEVNVAP